MRGGVRRAVAERVNYRNGYRPRAFDTRVGSIELAIPKLRRGSYFPDWLVEPRRRAERALVAVVAECYVRGVSTRRVERPSEDLGDRVAVEVAGLAAWPANSTRWSPVPQPAPGRGPYTYVWLDALTLKVREGGRIVNVAVVIAVGVNRDGHREILGLDVITSEDGAGWLAFLRGLVARGLAGMSLVISDAHPGLVDAIAATLAGAAWQRCRTHFMRNLLTRVPKSAQPHGRHAGADDLRAARRRQRAWAQHARVVDQLDERFPDAADATSPMPPPTCWRSPASPRSTGGRSGRTTRRSGSTRRLRRRTDVVGIFPNRDAVIRLVGAVLAEQHDEWAVARRYMGTESLAKARLHIITADLEEVTSHALSEVM